MITKVAVRICIGVAFLAFFATPAISGVEHIVEDLKPLPSVIVMEVQGEYLIDKDAGHGVRVGDIFTAVTPGEKIIHPLTKEVLGTLDQVRAQLRVSKVKSGYSYAVPLPGSSKLKAGETIVRYQGLPATFWDYTGDGESLHTALQSGLPALEWNSFESDQADKPDNYQKIEGIEGIVFVLTSKGLEIKDATFKSIRFYSRADLAKKGISIVNTSAIAVPVQIPDSTNKEPLGIEPAKDSQLPSNKNVSDVTKNGGIWYGPNMTGEIVGLDFIDLENDGTLEVVIAFSDKILVGSFANEDYKGVHFIEINDRLKVLGVDVADLDKDGQSEIYVSAVQTDVSREIDEVVSMAIDTVNGDFKIFDENIPFLFNRVDLPNEGQVLVAQQIANGEKTYGGKVYRMQRSGNKIKRGDKLDIDIEKITVHGFTVTESSNQNIVVLFDINENLEVYTRDGQRLWAGNERKGGRQSFIEMAGADARADIENYFLKARISKLDNRIILVPHNEGSSRVFSKREFSKSKIIAMQWDGYALKELWETESQGGYMADFRVADVDNDGKDEIVMGVLFSQGGLFKAIQKRSALVVYELP